MNKAVSQSKPIFPDTVETDSPQHDRPAVCVIAQQYSSLAFMMCRLWSLKEEFAAF